MNLRWLIFDYVNPELGLSRDQRRTVRRRAWDLSFKQVKTKDTPPASERSFMDDLAIEHPVRPRDQIIAMIPMMCWNFVPAIWIFLAGFDGLWSLIGFFPLYILGLWVTIAFAGRRTWRPLVLRSLLEQGFRICPGCGYSLEGLEGEHPTCPECGREHADPYEETVGKPTETSTR